MFEQLCPLTKGKYRWPKTQREVSVAFTSRRGNQVLCSEALSRFGGAWEKAAVNNPEANEIN